ncbi:hypothetical protein HQ545_05180 [Candidatus Woesearchaeota archaeon]|nr:hypothetical protein [Candidatus Woesearchaeota archaeon]
MKKSAVLFLILVIVITAACASAEDTYTYYLAGGLSGFDSWTSVGILNPGAESADVEIRLFNERNGSDKRILSIEAHSMKIINLSSSDTSFGAAVLANKALIVDYSVVDSSYSGGFGSSTSPKVDVNWYFSEGYNSGSAKTYLYILNPSSRPANVTVTLYYEGSDKKTFSVGVPARRHLSVDLKGRTLPEKTFGIKVFSSEPIVASAATFDKKMGGASGGIGSTGLSKKWYFADGFADAQSTSFLYITNPSLGSAKVKITAFYTDGSMRNFLDVVPSGSRKTFMLNNYVESGRDFSFMVESDTNVVAGYAYFDGQLGFGGIGAETGLTDQYFACSSLSDGVESYLAIFNPSQKETGIEITLYYEDGSVETRDFLAPSLMRSTFEFINVKSMPFGIRVKNTEPVVVSRVLLDKKSSCGFSCMGLRFIMFEEEVVLPDVVDALAVNPESDEDYVLMKEEHVAAARFSQSIRGDLSSVVKFTYDLSGNDIVAWRFNYDDVKSASDSLTSVLSGDLFKMLEVTPVDIDGVAMHYFVSEKSTGYAWLNDDVLFIVVAEDKDDALGLSLRLMISSPPDKKNNLSTILLIIGALIFLIVFIRWLSRHLSDDDDSVWAEMIPDAKPKTKKGEVKKNKKRTKKLKKTKKSNKSLVTDKQSQDSQGGLKKESQKGLKSQKESQKQVLKHVPKPVSIERRKKSITEVPREELTAQDILDNLEDIPDYEDVFRHVNRDHEEIKPR